MKTKKYETSRMLVSRLGLIAITLVMASGCISRIVQDAPAEVTTHSVDSMPGGPIVRQSASNLFADELDWILRVNEKSGATLTTTRKSSQGDH